MLCLYLRAFKLNVRDFTNSLLADKNLAIYDGEYKLQTCKSSPSQTRFPWPTPTTRPTSVPIYSCCRRTSRAIEFRDVSNCCPVAVRLLRVFRSSAANSRRLSTSRRRPTGRFSTPLPFAKQVTNYQIPLKIDPKLTFKPYPEHARNLILCAMSCNMLYPLLLSFTYFIVFLPQVQTIFEFGAQFKVMRSETT